MPKAKVTWNDSVARAPLNQAQKNLIAEGLGIERDVKLSMKLQGSGREYKVSKTGPLHHASAPWEPPAVLTGRLRASITTAWSGGQRPIPQPVPGNPKASFNDAIRVPEGSETEFKVVIGTNVEYAPYLELGTSKMSPRPFMRPAFERCSFDIIKSGAKSITFTRPMLEELAQEIGEFGTD